MKTAFVTGATGTIGPELINHLLKRGWHVRALVRNLKPGIRLPDEVEVFNGCLDDTQVLDKAVKNTDTVFHLAARLHINNPGPELEAEYAHVNIEGTRRLAEAALSADVRRFVFFSTINVYGASKKSLVHNEESPLSPDSFYSQTKVSAEEIVLNKLPAVVLRLAAVYGPQMKGNYPRLLNALQKRRFVLIGDGLNRRTLIHVYDACEAAVLAAEHPAASGRIYNVTDGRIHTMKEIIEAMCAALNKKLPKFYLPAAIMRPAFGVLEDGLGLLNYKSPVGRSTIDKLIEDLAASGERLNKELKFKPQYNLLKGWKDVIERYN